MKEKRRNKIAEEIKELHRRYWKAGFTSMTEEEYHKEIKILRFRWVTEY